MSAKDLMARAAVGVLDDRLPPEETPAVTPDGEGSPKSASFALGTTPANDAANAGLDRATNAPMTQSRAPDGIVDMVSAQFGGPIDLPDAARLPASTPVDFPSKAAEILASLTANAPGTSSDWADLDALGPIEHHHTCSCIACSNDREDSFDGNGDATGGETSGTLGILSDMADFLLTGYWNTGYGDGSRSHNATSSGTDANDGVLLYNLSGYSADADGVTDARANLIREAFKLFESTLGIQFVETTSTDTSEVDFFFRDNASGAYASHSYWNSGAWGSTITYAQINVAASWSGGTSTYDDYTFQTILHEIGHAMGLGHQGSYNGSAKYGTDNTFDNDNWQSTMMSYFSQSQATAVNASYEFLQTPMVVDWLALNEIYGRQGYGTENAYTENTTWGFNTTVTSDVSDVWATWSDWANRTASTIVDGGGIDTLDLSGYSNNTLINLAPSDAGGTAPSSSNIGGRTGNLTIAVGTIIENAVGGAGSETFYGNVADNILTGNGGNDTFYDSIGSDTYIGGAGNDYVIFGASFADYTYTLVNGVLQVIDAAIDWIDDTVEWLTFSDQTLSWQAIVDASSSPNAAPMGRADTFTVTEDALLTGGGLLDNDTDADGDALTVSTVEGVAVSPTGTSVTLASGAVVLMFADGTFEYDQRGAFDALGVGQQATDSFVYRAADGSARSGDTLVTITINGAFDNSGPVASNDTYVLDEDGTVWGSVLANDRDLDGDTLTVAAVNGSAARVGSSFTLQSGAVVTLNADGSFNYDTNGAFDDLNDGEIATDRFTYTITDGRGGSDTATVTMRIDGVSPPVASGDVLISFEGQAPGAYSGDYGLVFDGLNVTASSALSGAQAGTVGSDGKFRIMTAGEDFDLNGLTLINQSGRQKVLFEAYDDGVMVGSVQINVGANKATQVRFDSSFDNVDKIVVLGNAGFFVDDLALVTRAPIDPNGNFAPIGVNDLFSTTESTAVTANLLANDTDPNGDALILVAINGLESGPITLESGAIVTFQSNGAIAYDPNGAFDGLYDGQTGIDSFSYKVSDGRGGLAEATASVILAGQGTPPRITTVDFETAEQFGTTVTEAGFAFSDAVLTSAETGVSSGNLALTSGDNSITMTRITGDAFEFATGIVTLGGRGRETVTLEGYLDGVLIGVESFDIQANRETKISASDAIFGHIDRLVVTADDGVTLDDLSVLQF